MEALSKVVRNATDAVADIHDGAAIAVGGFGLSGIPTVLIQEVLTRDVGGFTVVSNNCGLDDAGVGLWLAAGKITKMISSYVGENDTFERQYLSGDLHVELTPQGTLAEKLRAGGSGIPAFFTPAGVGTLVAEGGLPWRYAPDGSVLEASPAKEIRHFDGKDYVLEESIVTDFSLIRARTADSLGNCVFHAAARNFNVPAGMAGKVTIVEAEEVVPAGSIDPDAIHLPGIFVSRVLALTPEQASDKRIERLTVRQREVN
ncbi:MAG: CoA transferase subunit A [Actinobacteria bacterium]|nr:CoA transferase subunit A [Actinomycetota bacterium]